MHPLGVEPGWWYASVPGDRCLVFFDDDDVYFEEDGICWIRWIKLETVFNSKRKFYMHYTFGEFSMGVMDAERLQIYYTEECSWISAKKRNRQPGAGRMRYN